MEVTFHGAAREVTGSCHVVRAKHATVLLDAGLFQGRRSEVRAKNERLPVDPGAIDAIVLSHAHIDHCGRLPYLVRRGYRGPVFTTPATRDLCGVMLADAAHIQEKDAEFLARRKKTYQEPLYRTEDAEQCIRQMRSQPLNAWFDIAPGLRARFTEAGHILGSASVVVESTSGDATRRIAFSGDIGRRGLSIVRDPAPPEDVDAIIMESTYGNREHESVAGAKESLARVVRDAAARGGKVLIPAFAVGRTQELIYALHELVSSGLIPEIPVVIDSPLAIAATDVFLRHAELFDRSERFIGLFGHDPTGVLRNRLVQYAQTAAESKEAMNRRGPMVIVAASGMAESGRILHHLRHGADDTRNTILIVGFQAAHTLGRRIVERRPVLKVYGDEVPLNASVEVLHGYSAHADRSGLLAWHDAVQRSSPRLRNTWLVHGEPDAQDALMAQLASRRYAVSCPEPGTRVLV